MNSGISGYTLEAPFSILFVCIEHQITAIFAEKD